MFHTFAIDIIESSITQRHRYRDKRRKTFFGATQSDVCKVNKPPMAGDRNEANKNFLSKIVASNI